MIIAAIMIHDEEFNSLSNVMIDYMQIKFIVLVKLSNSDEKIDFYQKDHCKIKTSWWQDNKAYLLLFQCQSCLIKIIINKVALYNFIEESKSWTICSWMFLTYLISWISLMSEVSLTSWMSLTSEVSLTSWISLTSEMFLTSWMSLTSFACQKSLKSLYHLTHRQSSHSCSTAFSFETAKSLCFLIWKWIHSLRIFREKNEWDSSRCLWLRKDDVVHVITCSNILHFFY